MTKPYLKVRDYLQKNNIPFKANDNISQALQDLNINKAELIPDIEEAFTKVLAALCIDFANDHNSKETAKRYAKMVINETFCGRFDPIPNITVFPNVSNADQIILVRDIQIESVCSHHHQNIRGKCHIGILPNPEGSVMGLSKYARLARWVARRPQIQEEMTVNIASILEDLLEPRGVAVVIDATHQCFDGQTEILTKNGWVRFDELPKGLKVAQVDPVTLKTSFVKPTAYIKQKNHWGILHHYKNRRVDIMCTPDHRFLMKTAWANYREDSQWQIRQSKDLPNEIYIPTAFNWTGLNFEVPDFGVKMTKKQFCAFMGLYQAEGCWRGRGCLDGKDHFKGIGVEIVQKEGTKDCKKIERFLRALFKNSVQKTTDKRGISYFFIHNEKIADYVIQFGRYCTEMFIPQIIKNASRKCIKAYLKWFYLGDGNKWQQKREDLVYSDCRQITTASKILAQDLQELYAKIGVSMNIHIYEGKSYQRNPSGELGNKYRLWEQKGKGKGRLYNEGKSYIRMKDRSIVEHKDFVYCVTVPSGIIITRRNNCIAVIGNCMNCRGVNEHQSTTVTSHITGAFRENGNLRAEFYELLKLGK